MSQFTFQMLPPRLITEVPMLKLGTWVCLEEVNKVEVIRVQVLMDHLDRTAKEVV